MAKYLADFDFKLLEKNLAALAFLPVADLIDTHEVLVDEFEDDKLPVPLFLPKTKNWVGLTEVYVHAVLLQENVILLDKIIRYRYN